MMEKGIEMQGEFVMPERDVVVVLPVGEGAIEPTDLYADEEVLTEVRDTQAEIEDGHVVCGDERHALEPQPVRPKMFGGNTVTGFAAAAYANWSFFTKELKSAGIMTMYDAVVDHQVSAGSLIGGHGGEEPCGASVNFPQITRDVIAIGKSELIREQASIDLGDLYDERVLDEVTEGAEKFAADVDINEWDPGHVEERVDQEGVLEELSGKNLHPEIDPDNKRHGHFAEAWNINHQKGKSNNRDATNIPYFQVDVPAIVEECQKLARDDKEFVKLLHAAMLFQYATGYRLTKNMRVTRTGQTA